MSSLPVHVTFNVNMSGNGTYYYKINTFTYFQEYITISIESDDLRVFQYRIKRNEMFQDTFIQFAGDIELSYEHVRFFWQGNQLDECETPEEWRMVDGDQIDGEDWSGDAAVEYPEEDTTAVTYVIETSEEDSQENV